MPTVPIDNSQVEFIQFQQPELKNGVYTIKVSISSADPTMPAIPSVTKVLQVGDDTPPALGTGVLRSVFPPEDSSGDYAGSLAHVVLTSRTLPWQRYAVNGVDNTPWLAVLLLTDDEYAAQIAKTPSTATVLNLDSTFFAQIAPSASDLAYLAHVRRVDTGNKEDSSDTHVDYSIVFGNRLPAQGTSCRAFLVSLEEMGPMLPPASVTVPNPVALPVLYSWRFFTIQEPRDFTDVVANLNAAPLALPPPTLSASPSAADQNVANSLAMGYKPALHTLRVGGQTVSWYRGPFAPYGVKRPLNVPINSGDAVCRYDPTTGMSDASCSAAWTLGRLMALNNGGFATGLYKWKRVTQRETIERFEYELATGQPPPPGSVSRFVRQQQESRLAVSLEQGLASLGGLTPEAAKALSAQPLAERKHVRRKRVTHQELRNALHDPARVAAVHTRRLGLLSATLSDTPEDTDALWAWMGDLALLKGVPFHYLVPDPAMLPAESIRFFQIDPSWLAALLDGAFSIGRSTQSDQAHDLAFAPIVKRRALAHASFSRNRRRGLLRAANPMAASDPPALARPVSGFLMRSMAVTQWPGLEVLANGPNGPANLLRMEKMQTILFCLFDQVVDSIIVQQPSEGLHFGLEDRDGAMVKYVRLLQAVGPKPVGTLSDTKLPSIPYRAESTGVLNIASLATAINSASNNPNPSHFTAAEFGLEMIVGVGQVNFQLTTPG